MAAELLKRLFLSEIQPKLFPGNSFLSRALNDDAFVNNNSVELPHSGTIPAVAVDRGSLPATIAKRTDAPTNYTLEELTTDPTLLQESEGLIVAYNKRASILDQHAKTINTKAADRALYKWAAGADAARIIPSTGTARAAGNTNGSQTLTRKAFTEADLLNIQRMFFQDDIVNELADVQGVAVITPRQYADLIALDSFKRADAYGQSNIPSGVVRRAYGFDFYVRSKVTVLAVGDTLKAEGAAGAATDQDAAVFYSPQYVRRAVGSIKPFINEDKAEYYGSIFSMLVRFGASPARNDNKGIYLLFEDN
jgi:hypothetical protein